MLRQSPPSARKGDASMCYHSPRDAPSRARRTRALDQHALDRWRDGIVGRMRRMKGGSRRGVLVSLASLLVVWPDIGAAQPYFYPTQGQSPQQEESDKGQCYGWAVKQTGFDPANPRVVTPASPPSYSGQAPPQQGGVLFGGLRRLRFEEQEQQQMQMRQQQAYAAQQQNALAQGRANYERAFGACMSGRGYSVR